MVAVRSDESESASTGKGKAKGGVESGKRKR
jgi:hypothetical protein